MKIILKLHWKFTLTPSTFENLVETFSIIIGTRYGVFNFSTYNHFYLKTVNIFACVRF